jgi:GTP-binding protein
MAPFERGRRPGAEAKAIAGELKKYDARSSKKPRWLVFNKADLLDAKEASARRGIREALRWTKPWFVISAINGGAASRSPSR